MNLNTIIHADIIDGLKQLPDESINCVVTSPPYYGLRDYGIEPSKWPEMEYTIFGFTVKVPEWTGCLGIEHSIEIYVGHIVYVFREVRRVLRKDGTLWLNFGDSYAAGKRDRTNEQINGRSSTITGKNNQLASAKQPNTIVSGLKPKDLCGISWRIAFALQSDGWWLRQDIIWHKPNPMPSSVKDRCTTAHEYIFLLSKSRKYYYNAYAIAEPYKDKTLTTFGCEQKGNGDGSGMIQSENWKNSISIHKPKEWKMPDGWDTGEGAHGSFHREGREKGKRKEFDSSQAGGGSTFKKGHSGNYDANGNLIGNGKANKRSVWSFPTQSFKDAHFATFPLKLPLTCIKAGCPPKGIVLDPFFGSGTTGLAALKLNRKFIGIELNPEYIKIAEERLRPYLEQLNFDFE